MKWELMFKRQVYDLSIINAKSIQKIFIVIIGNLEEISFFGRK